MSEPNEPIDPIDPHYDLADAEEKQGMDLFRPVLIGSAVVLIAVLLAALLLLTDMGKRLLPGRYAPHPTSYVVPVEPAKLTA